ncbi:MAG: MFS transporter [Candidatus Odinarchaeum yellowstonii]|uniref:MFS transporter n=1 Tax=Odinarchaeota yellowstonii (strain LCB_4) TaxID=1841599 RepID=A0AAF0D3B1_ODILC|nr:MAG: MFS transporter [Candidatus Odinarchaeum yellowstonii]
MKLSFGGGELSLQTGRLISPLTVIFITLLVDSIGYGLVIPLIPFYALQFGASSILLGVLVSVFALMQFFFAPFLGRLSDRVGRRKILLYSLFFSVISFIIFTFASSFIMLLASRIIAGMATEYSIAYAYISDITGEKSRTSSIGKIGAASNIGIILGPVLGGFVNIYGRFWLPGLTATVLTVLNLLFIYFFLPETVKLNNNGGSGFKKFSPFSYIKDITLIVKSSTISLTLGIVFAMGFAFAAMPVVLPLYSWDVFGLGEAAVGVFFAYIGVIGFIIQFILVGKVSKKIRDEFIILTGVLLTFIGVFTMPLLPSIIVFMTAVTVISIGVFLADVALCSFLSKKTSPEYCGATLGISESVSSIARIPGPIIAGLAYQLSIYTPFYVAGALIFTALFLNLMIIFKK